MKPAKARGELALGKISQKTWCEWRSLSTEAGRGEGEADIRAPSGVKPATNLKNPPEWASFHLGPPSELKKDRQREKVSRYYENILFFYTFVIYMVCIKQYICTNLFLCFLVREMNSWPFWCWSKVARGRTRRARSPGCFSLRHI